MAEFDQVAYSAAYDLFHRAKRMRNSLPSLIAQTEDAIDMLGAQRYDAPKVSAGGNSVEEALVDLIDANDRLVSKLIEERKAYSDVQGMCEAAIADMEEHVEGDWLDSAVLRYFYMQDLDASQIVSALEKEGKPYTISWIYQKKEIALIRVAAAVRRLHFF